MRNFIDPPCTWLSSALRNTTNTAPQRTMIINSYLSTYFNQHSNHRPYAPLYVINVTLFVSFHTGMHCNMTYSCLHASLTGAIYRTRCATCMSN